MVSTIVKTIGCSEYKSEYIGCSEYRSEYIGCSEYKSVVTQR